MNSLSYACSELLEGEDGLSDAARAERQREWEEICEPIRAEQAETHHSPKTNPSRSATTNPPPKYNSGTEEARTETLQPADEESSIEHTVALKPKTEWTYIAYCYRIRGEGLFKFFQYPSVGYVDPKAVFYAGAVGLAEQYCCIGTGEGPTGKTAIVASAEHLTGILPRSTSQ